MVEHEKETKCEEQMKNFLKSVKWYEWVFMSVSYIAILTLGIVFKSSALIILNSITGITATFLIAKGLWIGNVIGIMQVVLYCTMSFFNNLYGEIITCGVFSFSTYCFSLYSWRKNRKEGSGILKISNGLKWQEWVCVILALSCVSVGMYFVLGVLNTNNLIISTICVGFSTLAYYLRIRRCEKNFIFSCLINVIKFVLWMSVIINGGGLNYIPTIINYVIYFCINAFGLFYWIKLKKLQNLRKQKAEQRILSVENKLEEQKIEE